MTDMSDGYIDIVFDGPPSSESGRFVEVEDSQKHSIAIGEWIQDGDLWRLRIPDPRRIAELKAEVAKATSLMELEAEADRVELARRSEEIAELELERDDYKILSDELVEVRRLVGLPEGTTDDWMTLDLVRKRIAELQDRNRQLRLWRASRREEEGK